MRFALALLLLAAGCGGDKPHPTLGDRYKTISTGDRIDESTVPEKGKITALLYFADW